MTRKEMIDEMMEGVAFEDDGTIERVISKYNDLSDDELRAEFKEFMGEYYQD